MKRNLHSILLFLLSGFFSVLVSPVIAGDYMIVPGKRIGSVVLGDSLQAVHEKLHAPKKVRRLRGGIIEESWSSHLTIAQQHSYKDEGLYWKSLFVNVYFQRGRAVQVEVNSPKFHTRSHLSATSPAAAFRKQYKPYHSSDGKRGRPLLYGTRDQSGGYPGYKHYVTLEDATQEGIAWRYGAWGDLAPEPDPDLLEIVVVHQRGYPAILEPDAGNRFVVTSHDKGYAS